MPNIGVAVIAGGMGGVRDSCAEAVSFAGGNTLPSGAAVIGGGVMSIGAALVPGKHELTSVAMMIRANNPLCFIGVIAVWLSVGRQSMLDVRRPANY